MQGQIRAIHLWAEATLSPATISPTGVRLGRIVFDKRGEMQKRPTSTDVAREAGVSQSTVSRTFRNDPRVVEATRNRVLGVAESMGYYPNSIARSMVTLKSGSIAVVVPDVMNPVFAEIITSAHEELQRREMHMMLFVERNFELGAHDVLGVEDLPVDGMLVASATMESEVLPEIIRRKIPAVLIQRDFPGAELDRLMPDDERGCELVAEHLLELGHSEIGMIAGSPRTSSGRARLNHFRKALESRGLSLDERLVRIAEPSFEGSASAVKELLELDRPPTALFCGSDTIAITAMDIARRMGRRVPQDVSIVGFDDIDAASWSMVDLTTVRQEVAPQARTALEMLLERIDGSKIPARSVNWEVSLVTRGTTGPVPTQS